VRDTFRFFPWLALALLAGCGGETATPPAARPETPTAATATVAIDYGGEAENRTLELPHVADTTLLAALRAAAARGELEIEVTGEGTNAHVRGIDGVQDEGAGDAARNWQLWVNGDYATKGAGSLVVEPGDEFEWKYTTRAKGTNEQ
jgi:hypothetical protein